MSVLRDAMRSANRSFRYADTSALVARWPVDTSQSSSAVWKSPALW